MAIGVDIAAHADVRRTMMWLLNACCGGLTCGRRLVVVVVTNGSAVEACGEFTGGARMVADGQSRRWREERPVVGGDAILSDVDVVESCRGFWLAIGDAPICSLMRMEVLPCRVAVF
uniref:Uncharacterized protein n=1 Tax=Populus alba TaxID=43335 RepID=A0A4V6A7Y6_POPAL|nr:hypothetical protein D5086_0000178490 [Populus alba]